MSSTRTWMLRICAGCLAVYVLLALAVPPAYAVQPPKGTAWKEDIQSGRSEAAARKVPIMMYVAGDDAGSTTISQSMGDPKVLRMLRNFACVFISSSYNRQKFQSSYVPWIGATPQTTHRTPIVIFGDMSGNQRKEFRVEGKSMRPGGLLAHLEKVLRTLAPNLAREATGKTLKTMTLPEYCERLEDSQTFLENNMYPDKVVLFRQEAGSALQTMKFLKKKLARIKDKEKKVEAGKRAREMGKYLKKLAKYKGKEKEHKKYEGYVENARKALDKLKTVIESIKVETETLKYRAAPSRKNAAADKVKSDLEKLDYVTRATFEETDESVKVKETELKVCVFTITCERDKAKKADIERVFKRHGYEASWTGTKK